jgi:hypothetical protein
MKATPRGVREANLTCRPLANFPVSSRFHFSVALVPLSFCKAASPWLCRPKRGCGKGRSGTERTNLHGAKFLLDQPYVGDPGL